TVGAADRVQERDPVGREQVAQFGKERVVILDADMLEHADRCDAVELAFDGAVIPKLKTALTCQARGGGAVIGDRQLLARQRYTQDVGVVLAREIEPETAPARSDVEDFKSGPVEIQLGRNVKFLGGLRRLQRHPRMAEVSAGIVEVVIEEEIVERARQIIMASHIATGAPRAVELG